LQFDVPVVTKAFLSHDVDSLRDYCGPEMMQRAEGICKAFQEQVRSSTLIDFLRQFSHFLQSIHVEEYVSLTRL
jgi:hypothetical protein